MSYSINTGFFAYPTVPASSGDSIRQAVRQLNSDGFVQMKTWEECKVGGKFVINTICKEIEKADIFCADLTGINPNVLFELGYAVALDKRIWLAIDPSYSDKKQDFDRLRFLTTVGYAQFSNSRDIVDNFYADEVYNDPLDHGLFRQMIAPSLDATGPGGLLYIKSQVESEASIQLGSRIIKSSIPLTVDDPTEVPIQTLTWYGMKTDPAIGIICHLMSPERAGYLINNARNAFVAGLAFGLKKPLLMLAEGDLLGPLDYRDISKNYKTSEKALEFLEDWLRPLEKTWEEEKRSQAGFQEKVRLATELKTLQLGEPLAENESEGLIDHYFIETAAFRDATDGRHSIFVGRKGSGKSANFLKLSATVGKSPKNLVCEIKPISYELQTITELVTRITENSAKSFTLESLWKFLIYSEIANTLTREIEEFRSSASDDDQKALLTLMNRNSGMLREEFSLRLERCIEVLTANVKANVNLASQNLSERQNAIAQSLHEDVLAELRIVLGRILSNRKNVFVLVDNLDKTWDKQSNLRGLSEFFLGLLGAVKRIRHDFQRGDSRLQPINLSVAVFLRSDIFHKVKSIAREPDKLDHYQLEWTDKEMLLRLLEERFVTLNDGTLPPSTIWRKYFVGKVNGISTKNYLVDRVLPRPRDLIVLVKAAISTAVNRGHTKVESSDITAAEKIYSRFAMDSLLVEDGMSGASLQEVMYHFFGSESIVDRVRLFEYLSHAGVKEEDFDAGVEHLCSLTFLGPEVQDGVFRFAEGPEESAKNHILARKLAARIGKPIRYQIHHAYWPYLEVSETIL